MDTNQSDIAGDEERARDNHGGTGTSLYYRWRNMKTCCDNPNSNRYSTYGALGISYCKEWKVFSNFRDWALSNGYKEELTLERVKVHENYAPDNCTWVSSDQQARNKKMSKRNSTGVTGVVLNGANSPKPRYIANWNDAEGRRRSKSFGIKKYGETGAFQKACDYRKAMIDQLQEQGITYGEFHGL